ncbi:MAG TPA: aldehyde dehydrogenase [Tissierellales bacterium]|nr:aldehyde dehydrogenase [Tissierellales bacterium]
MDYIDKVLMEQRKFFYTGKTSNINFRLNTLKTLKDLIISYEKEIEKALNKDLNKSAFEAYTTEIGIVLSELTYIIDNIKNWSKPKKVKTSITNFKATSYIYPEPYGITLIIAPWNYPFQLCFAPLIGSISAGNTAIIKPSEYAPCSAKLFEKIINNNFPKKYIHIINGDIETSKVLLNKKYDYIFYTGSTSVGQIVMTKAAKHLTPITLELGGKSPCIVDKEGDLDLYAKRIVWGKLLNTGQTCVAPDYLLVHQSVKKELINNLIKYIEQFYGKNPANNREYIKIINEKHFKRLINLFSKSNIIYGGQYNLENLYISPTLINQDSWDGPIMEEEIFGPILPIIEYETLDEIIEKINNRPKPLALYFFSSNKEKSEKIINNISFGGGAINDTIMHLSSPYLPFGGVGPSGMGSYHGKKSFDTFTHYKSILKKSNLIDPNFRYPPYKGKLKAVKKILK